MSDAINYCVINKLVTVTLSINNFFFNICYKFTQQCGKKHEIVNANILEYLISDDILYGYINSVNEKNNIHYINIIIKLLIKMYFIVLLNVKYNDIYILDILRA